MHVAVKHFATRYSSIDQYFVFISCRNKVRLILTSSIFKISYQPWHPMTISVTLTLTLFNPKPQQNAGNTSVASLLFNIFIKRILKSLWAWPILAQNIIWVMFIVYYLLNPFLSSLTFSFIFWTSPYSLGWVCWWTDSSCQWNLHLLMLDLTHMFTKVIVNKTKNAIITMFQLIIIEKQPSNFLLILSHDVNSKLVQATQNNWNLLLWK